MLFNIGKKQPKNINIYADESSIDNENAPNMIIGAVFIQREKAPKIKEEINKLRDKFFIRGELKWTKTSKKTLEFYEALFKYLFSLNGDDFNFKCIVVKKDNIDYKTYHEEDKELAFYKFYYQLLKNRIEKEKEYYIFLDFKPSKSKDRVRRIGEFLELVNPEAKIKHIQAYSSKDNIFIQIADVLSGAVGYEKNYKKKSSDKNALMNVIAKNINKENLNFCSSFSGDKKFNIFCIKLAQKSADE